MYIRTTFSSARGSLRHVPVLGTEHILPHSPVKIASTAQLDLGQHPLLQLPPLVLFEPANEENSIAVFVQRACLRQKDLVLVLS